MSLLISIVVFILILAVLVIVHEFGHFIVAKKSGIRVDEFGFGFPPRAKKLFTKNGTDFTLNWIPFGGFVKIFGENGSEGEHSKDSFVSKKKITQAAVLFAGPFFNLLFAWIILSCMFMFGAPTLYDDSLEGYIQDVKLAVVEIVPDSPADQSEVLVGDQIVSLVYGSQVIPVSNPQDVTSQIKNHGTEEVVLNILRKGEEVSVSLTPSFGLFEKQMDPAVGIILDEMGTLKLPIHKAFIQGFERTWDLTKNTIVFVFDLIHGLVSGDKGSAASVTGPVGIVPVVGNAIQIGFSFVVVITALISINLAIINLLPFPALDGGRLLFVLIEKIKGGPINPKLTSWINSAGFVILLGLMLLVTVRDIVKLF